MWTKALALLLSLALAGAAWAQKGLPKNSVPYAGGAGTVGWLHIGPCTNGQAVGYVTGGVVSCITPSGGGGGITTISAGSSPTYGFSSGDVIASSGGVVWDTNVNYLSLGTVTDIFAACAGNIVGGQITTTGTISIVDIETTVQSTNFTVAASQCGNTIKLSAGTPFTATLPTAGSAGFGTGAYFDFCNFGSATVTISPASGSIAGNSSFTMLAGTASAPYCARILYSSAGAYDAKFVTPSLAIGALSAGTTLVGGATSGYCLYVSGGVLYAQTCASTIVAGGSITSGFTDNDLIASVGNLAFDSGIAYSNVGQLSANQTWSGSNIFSGTLNVTGTFQDGGNTFTFPAAADTLGGLGTTQTWIGVNNLSGGAIFKHLRVAVRSSGAATVTVSAATDYFLCLDPTSNAITVNLPGTPTTGDTYLIKDCTGQSGTNAITITPASGNIDGAATSSINSNYSSKAVTYTGSQWSVN